MAAAALVVVVVLLVVAARDGLLVRDRVGATRGPERGPAGRAAAAVGFFGAGWGRRGGFGAVWFGGRGLVLGWGGRDGEDGEGRRGREEVFVLGLGAPRRALAAGDSVCASVVLRSVLLSVAWRPRLF